MLTQDQLTTIRAALRYWQDEIVPAGPSVAAAYYDAVVNRDLRADEIDRLIEQFQANKTRCVILTRHDHVLAVTRRPVKETGANRTATLIFGPKPPIVD